MAAHVTVDLRHPTSVPRASVQSSFSLSLSLSRARFPSLPPARTRDIVALHGTKNKSVTHFLACVGAQDISTLPKSTTTGCCEMSRLVTVGLPFSQARARCAITCQDHPLHRSSSRRCSSCCQRPAILCFTTAVMAYSVGVVHKSGGRCSRALTMRSIQRTIGGRS